MEASVTTNGVLSTPCLLYTSSTKYIAYFLESKIKEYQAIAIGGAQPFVGLDIFRKMCIRDRPISEQAYNLCGEQKEGELLVFAGLPDPSWINRRCV